MTQGSAALAFMADLAASRSMSRKKLGPLAATLQARGNPPMTRPPLSFLIHPAASICLRGDSSGVHEWRVAWCLRRYFERVRGAPKRSAKYLTGNYNIPLRASDSPCATWLRLYSLLVARVRRGTGWCGCKSGWEPGSAAYLMFSPLSRPRRYILIRRVAK